MTWNRRITPEGNIKRQVKEYLRLKGWFIFPVMQGPLSYLGISDFIAVKKGVVVFIEVKTSKGILSIHQKNFRDDMLAHEGNYYVVRSLEDVQKMELILGV